MVNLFDLLLEKTKIKCEIKVKIDNKSKKALTEINGNLPGILTGIAIIVSKLSENNVPKELIRKAVEIGFDKNPKKENKEIIEKKIIIDNEEKVKKIKELLEKLED